MAGRPRGKVINEDQVGVYHCWTRGVRRSRLCGFDPFSGNDYSHRKKWIAERLKELAHIFAIDACVWAILANHYHLILRNRPDLVEQWSDVDVARRWLHLYPKRNKDGRTRQPTAKEIQAIVGNPSRVAELRKRLSSISWFMKSINETIAVRANAEEDQTGHFWQGRFGCRSLLDEGAILACSIYVDLNEIRAQLASTPEDSRNTSAYRRILAKLLRQARETHECLTACNEAGNADDPDYWMCPVDDQQAREVLTPDENIPSTAKGQNARRRHGFLPISLDQYLELLDWTGRQLFEPDAGSIDPHLPPILERLGIRSDAWSNLIEMFESGFHSAVGNAAKLRDEAARRGQKWLHGLSRAPSALLNEELALLA